MLEDERERKKCLEVVEEARERVEKMVSQSHLPPVRSFQNKIHIFFLTEKEIRNL